MRSPAPFSPALLCALLAACWSQELTELPDAEVAFDPEIGDAPEGWMVAALDVNLACPNGSDARFYTLYPQDAATSGQAVPTAVIYHSGAFDFVYAPTTEDPLAGTHYAAPSRLDGGWAIRNIFVTLGMLPDEVEAETHTGVLPTALARDGIAMIFPSNCWGDWWHNRSGIAANDFDEDLFVRDGRTAAVWGYQLASTPGAAMGILGQELPFVPDPTEVYAIGLGEGGRAVTEVLSLDENADGIADHQPVGAIVDSVADDLSIYFADPALFGNAVAGLSRIFPDSDTRPGSLSTAALPARFGYLYALQDPEIPRASHLAAMDILLPDAAKWVYVTDSSRHVLLNSDDEKLATDAVSYLRTGVVPPPGDGVPVAR